MDQHRTLLEVSCFSKKGQWARRSTVTREEAIVEVPQRAELTGNVKVSLLATGAWVRKSCEGVWSGACGLRRKAAVSKERWSGKCLQGLSPKLVASDDGSKSFAPRTKVS